MTVQDDINAASNTQPSIEQRIQAIHDAGGGYIDPSLQATLAQGDQPTSGLGATVHAITQTVTSDIGTLAKSVRTVFEDPVLYKQPSAPLRLHQFLTQQLGYAPVAQVDLTKVQSELQKQGYGKNLSLSGVWTSDWQNVFHQASIDHYQAQRSSNEGGGFNAEHALGGFLSAFMPSHAIPALIGAVKALPSDVRQLAADTAGYTVQAGQDLAHGDISRALKLFTPYSMIDAARTHETGEAAQVGADIQNFANHNPVTAQQFSDEHGWTRAIENANTLLSVLPVMRLGGTVAEAGGRAVALGLFKDLGPEAAQRGPGVIAHMLYKPASEFAAGSPTTGDTGLLAARAFDHLPFLKQMMPAVRTGVANGQRWWYYTARPFAAAPYRLPIVNAAGHIAQQTMFTGALLRGDAVALKHIDPNAGYSKSVLGQKPYTGPVGMALDLLGSVSHGPLNNRLPLAAHSAEEAAAHGPAHVPAFGMSPSQQVGDIIRKAMSTYDGMLGKPGVIGAWERGTGLNYADTLKEFQAAGLDKTDLDWTIQSKVDQLAAGHGAHQELRDGAARGLEREGLFKQRSMEIRQDPVRLAQYRGELLDSDAALANRFAQDHNQIIQGAKAAVGSMVQEAKARKVAYQLVNDPTLAWQNVHGGTFQALRNAQEEHAFATAMGDEAGAKPALTASWLRANNPDGSPASLGIARSDRLLSDDVRAKAAEYERLLTKARTPASGDTDVAVAQDSAALRSLRKQVGQTLLEVGIAPEAVPGDLEERIALLRQRANDLATKVKTPLNPTPEYTAARKALNDLGYELVHGTGIGFEFTPPVIDPVVVDGGISAQRKALEKIGLGSTYSGTQDAAQWRQLLTIRAWQKLINDGKLELPPGWTPSTVYRHAYENLPSRGRLSGVSGGVFKLAERTRWRKMAADMAGPGATQQDVDAKLAEIEKNLAEQKSLLDLSEKDFVTALTARPQDSLTNELRDMPSESGLLTPEQALLMRQAMIGAIARSPSWMFGLHADDLLRAGGAGFAGARTANSKVLRRVATAGNDYTRFRNTFRFGIDPIFSFRRIVKSYLKLSTEGVPTSIHLPYEAMKRQGTLDSDLALADRLFPETRGTAEGYDPLDRTIYQADLMGLFNPRHFYAYAAGWLQRMGKSDAEIKAAVNRALTYGQRSALERTVGTIFYPFSFEKTLYRQVGAKLLDEPGQRFMALAALDAWHALNHDDRLGQWAQAHAPLLMELKKLNAFDHGVGPGQVGGINAPLAGAVWNAFRPQLIDKPSNHAYETAAAAVPLFGELNSLLFGYSPNTGEAHGGSVLQQAGITWQEAQNRAADIHHWVFNENTSPWSPAKPAETYQAQQNDAWSLRNHLILQYAAVIDYNYHHKNAEATFPTDGSVPSWLAGQPVTRATIDEIVHRWYPDYDPTKAQTIAVAKQTDIKRFITNLTASNPDAGAAYKNFQQQADKFITYKSRAELDPALWPQLAQITEQFRQYAVAMSEQSALFRKFYDRYYTSQLGPLEALTS